MRTVSTLSMRSPASTPYAPTFCTALAPTSPGMSERFSSPHHPFSTVYATSASQLTPLPTRSSTSSALSPTTSISIIVEWKTVPSKSSTNSRLLPPPMTSDLPLKPPARKSTSASTEENSTRRAALASMPKVLRSKRETSIYCFIITVILQDTTLLSCDTPCQAGQRSGTRCGYI